MKVKECFHYSNIFIIDIILHFMSFSISQTSLVRGLLLAGQHRALGAVEAGLHLVAVLSHLLLADLDVPARGQQPVAVAEALSAPRHGGGLRHLLTVSDVIHH